MADELITVDGLADLSRALTELPARTAKRYLTNAADPAAEVVEDAMRQTAPIHTGELAGSAMHVNRFSDGPGNSTALITRIGPSKEAFYGLFPEFGTKPGEGRTKKSGRHWVHAATPALHWFQRAWESVQDKVLSVFATELLARLADMEAKK